jgi:serine/arginine repetitive matrix protein 2
MSSSPDPLNDSPTFHGHLIARRTSLNPQRRSVSPKRVQHSTQKKTNRSSQIDLLGPSPKKQTFELDVGDRISPHKIRVTVEAGSSDAEHAMPEEVSPVPRRRVRTTTTRVPVKSLEDNEDNVATPKRGPGRPRKSMGTPLPIKKRARVSTPKGKRGGKSFGQGNGEEEDAILEIGDNVEVARGVSRSQSRARKAPQRQAGSMLDKNLTAVLKSRRATRRNLAEDEDPRLPNRSDDLRLYSYVDHNDDFGPTNRNIPSANTTERLSSNLSDDRDVVIAKLHPRNETPRRTGWSSPKTSEGRDLAAYPEAEPMSDLAQNADEDHDEVSIGASSRRGSLSSNGNMVDDGEDDHGVEDLEEADDEIPREFDTIMESEGFSMISVDSVQSLQEIRSSPWNQVGPQQPEAPVRNKSLLSVVQTQSVEDDSFSIIPEEVLEAASPKKFEISRPLSESSKAKVPEKALDSNMLAHKSHLLRLVSTNHSRIEDSFSSIVPKILDAATPRRVATKAATIKDDPLYEDSFSAIPGSVLEAATPVAKRTIPSDNRNSASNRPTSKILTVLGPKKSLFPSQVVNKTSPRLLTPEETPSPTSESLPTMAGNSAADAPVSIEDAITEDNQYTDGAPGMDSYMASSPPSVAPRRYTYTEHLRQHRHLLAEVTETPAITFSSPSLPPPIQLPRLQTSLQDLAESRRPTLSPIARTGQILQAVVVPLSSPRSRSQSLGSPFKSPSASRTSSSIVRGSPHERETGLPKATLSANMTALSSHNPEGTRPANHEDPFSSSTRAHRSPSLQDKELYTLELPGNRATQHQSVSSAKSRFESLCSEDAMSWQLEEEIDLSGKSATATSNLTSEQRWADEKAQVSKQISGADSDKVITIDSDTDEESGSAQYHDEDEGFDLLLETMGSSSPIESNTPAQNVAQKATETEEKPRRGKIPSPWRKNSKRLVYSDDMSQMSTAGEKKSSVAGNIIEGGLARPVTARRTVIEDRTSDDLDAEVSGLQIPQKSNVKPRARAESVAANLSILLGDSPPKLPVLPARSHDHVPQFDGNASTSSREDSHNNFLPRETTKANNENSFMPIPQKLGFAPRSRTEPSEFLESSPRRASLFGDVAPTVSQPLSTFQSKANIPLGSAALSRMSLSSEGRYDNSSSTTSSVEKENGKFKKRTLKWTEKIQLESIQSTAAPSPSKSCLRSPLKTPTASRVSPFDSPSKAVAFVSSSPAPLLPKEPLFATAWSKNHWILLESIVNAHRPTISTDSSSSSSDVSNNQSRRRNSTRVISKLLGRTVRAEGESMVLQQWHLEVVDEFRGVVAGWEEKVVAMRVFALVKGEEKRARAQEEGNRLRNVIV